MQAEASAEVGAPAETAGGGNLDDGVLGLFDQQAGGVFETQLQGIVVEPGMVAALGENGAHTLLRQLEAVHDGLASEIGIEV